MDEGISPWDSVDGLVDDASDVSVQPVQAQEQQDPSVADGSLAEAAAQAQEDAMRMLAAGVSLPHPGEALIGGCRLAQQRPSPAAMNGASMPAAAYVYWRVQDRRHCFTPGDSHGAKLPLPSSIAAHVRCWPCPAIGS